MKALNRKLLISVFMIISLALVGCSNETSKNNSSSNLKYPEKPIKLIVPFAAGGGASTTAQLIAKYSEKPIGQSIVVENREGGGGTAGQQYVASVKPDGYTLLLLTGSAVTNPIFNKTSFTYKDFAPIIQVVSDVSYLYVNAKAPYDDFDSFVEYAKENPGKVTIATSGAQASDNYAGKELIEALGIKATTIPYDGEAPAIVSVAGGHDTASIANFGAAEGQVQSGNLKPILVLSKNKSEKYADIPTSYEKGVEVSDESWRGIAAPKGTDPKIIDYLHEKFKEGFDDPEYQDKMKNMGMETVYSSPQELEKKMEEVFKRFSGK